ncbi:MAG: GDP-mannose 4,6-dehydratase [Gemmatimonadota bacterium]
MKVLVTGADGFVGGWLVHHLLACGDAVVGAIRMGATAPAMLKESERMAVHWIDFDLMSPDSVDLLTKERVDAVIHLAAIASGSDARSDPAHAWSVNAAGTARLAEGFGHQVVRGEGDPMFLLVSTGEVYGQGNGVAHLEADPLIPCSPYAASKVGAEVAALEVHRRTGLRALVARSFPHTGPGQSEKYVIPALALRLRAAGRAGAPVIKAGNLEPVRDLLDVRDVVAAYRLLVERGAAGTVYNVASGVGHSLADVKDRLANLLGFSPLVENDPALGRSNDLQHLVGDPGRLVQATGWTPRLSLDQTLRDLIDAQAD